MYSLFVLLFRKDYWRMLLRGASWLEAWQSLRRIHKDKRARKHLRRFLTLLLIPIVCVAYLAWIARLGALVLLPFVLLGVWWSNWRRNEDAKPIHIAPVSGSRELTEKEVQSLRAYFGELALFYCVMTDRANSETYLKTKELPENFEVTSRRRHLDLLRSTGLWDRMAQRDREAMMMADGHWEWPLIHHVASYLEPVRLLRWILRIDVHLPVVGRQLRSDYGLSHEIVQAPQRVLKAKELVTMRDMERAQGAAQEFFGRCLAESLNRGYHTTEDAEMLQWAKNVSAALKGKQHEDLLLGDKLVSEIDEPGLRWATELSKTRMRFLNWTLPFFRGAIPPAREMSVFAAEAPSAEPEALTRA